MVERKIKLQKTESGSGRPVAKKVPDLYLYGGSQDVLSAGDIIEYSLTEEVSPGPGQKGWIKWGVTSAVKPGENINEAVSRIVDFVEKGIEDRIEKMS